MRECRCLNLHSHPEPTKGCCEGCMMCCGYTTPAMVELLIAALVIVSDVYSIILIARNPHSAWRIIVCLIVFILTSAYGAAVSWAYYAIIFTSPGFVPRETWQHPPTYVGPPHLLREPLRASVPFSGNKAAPTLAQQQQQEQPVAPTISRRSPNNSGGDLSQRSRSLTPPTSSPPPPPAVQPAHTQMSSVNPLQDGHDANSRKPAQDEGAVVVYCDSVESGNGSRQRCQPPEIAAQPMEHESHTVYVGGPTGRHSPYATPNGPHSAAAATTRPVSIPPLNPYQVRSLAQNGSLRFCHACRLYKPDAAHHCSVCGRCVFNFDHHCPFVNNCVGRNNYKIFVLFLLYAGVGATVSGGLMAVTLFAVDKDDIMSKIGWVAVPAVDVVLGLSLFLFYIQHRVLLCNGESTLDSIVRSDDTFQGWRQSLSRPRRTAAENAEMKRLKKERAERHNRTLLGNESPWWRRYLPIPVRTDDNGEDTVPGNI